jgi:hypothetical protein
MATAKQQSALESARIKVQVRCRTVADLPTLWQEIRSDPGYRGAWVGDLLEVVTEEWESHTSQDDDHDDELEDDNAFELVGGVAENHLEMEPLIPGLLPRGLQILVGNKKAGKSYFALQCCLAVCCADEGWTVFQNEQEFRAEKAGKALIIDLERSKEKFRARLDWLHPEQTPGLKNLRRRNTFGGRLDKQGVGKLEDLIREWRPAIVVIDSMRAVEVGGRERSQDPQGADYRQAGLLAKLAQKYKITILLLCHTRKGQIRKGDDPFDSQDKTKAFLAPGEGAMLIWPKRGIHELIMEPNDGERKTYAMELFSHPEEGLRVVETADGPRAPGWVFRGKQTARLSSQERGEMLDFIEERPGLKEKAIAMGLASSKGMEFADSDEGKKDSKRWYDTVRQRLHRMKDAEQVIFKFSRYYHPGYSGEFRC